MINFQLGKSTSAISASLLLAVKRLEIKVEWLKIERRRKTMFSNEKLKLLFLIYTWAIPRQIAQI